MVKHFDVKTAFLYGKFEEEIFIKQPSGFVVKNAENNVCHLKKSLYGLKQAAWNQRFFDGSKSCCSLVTNETNLTRACTENA